MLPCWESGDVAQVEGEVNSAKVWCCSWAWWESGIRMAASLGSLGATVLPSGDVEGEMALENSPFLCIASCASNCQSSYGQERKE